MIVREISRRLGDLEGAFPNPIGVGMSICPCYFPAFELRQQNASHVRVRMTVPDTSGAFHQLRHGCISYLRVVNQRVAIDRTPKAEPEDTTGTCECNSDNHQHSDEAKRNNQMAFANELRITFWDVIVRRDVNKAVWAGQKSQPVITLPKVPPPYLLSRPQEIQYDNTGAAAGCQPGSGRQPGGRSRIVSGSSTIAAIDP